MILTTHYAPAEREDTKAICHEAELIPEQLKAAFDALPYIALIINNSRQLVFANAALLQNLGMERLEEALGARPGEVVHCIHSHDSDGGCGTSESCRHCGAVNVILQSQQLLIRTSGECRITTLVDGRRMSLDLRVTCTPFTFASTQFFLVFMEDISAQKRKQQLERTFFHDIINTCGGLMNAARHFDILQTDDQRKQFCSHIYRQSHILMEEILAQRDLLAAENNTLEASFEKINATALLNEAIESTKLLPVADGQKIELEQTGDGLTLETDPRLLRRVFSNLLKNAIEAPNNGGSIKAGVTTAENDVVFWVANSATLAEGVRCQIFQRSFSTKGRGRGTGTYSMKLLVEVYLHGTVTFTSTPEEGTVFYVRLPQSVGG